MGLICSQVGIEPSEKCEQCCRMSRCCGAYKTYKSMVEDSKQEPEVKLRWYQKVLLKMLW